MGQRGYAVVVGEALVDLIETECGGERVYRPMVGGAPLNVAVGLTRLGNRVEFLGALGRDVLGGRIRDFLAEAGVGTGGCVEVDVPTTLAVTNFRNAEPDFHFYGQPPSYSLFRPDDVNPALVRGATIVYCGSISLLCEPSLAAARRAWAEGGPLRAFDPNVRPHLLPDPTGLRAVVEEFAATADLVKLSEPDARVLFDTTPEQAAAHLRSLGAAAVVVTLGAAGALVDAGVAPVRVPAPPVHTVDTTGAGDAAMAGLLHALRDGVPPEPEGWPAVVASALQVASLSCERAGGAASMPTLAEVRSRFGPRG